jgi:hypothetical protein
VVSDRASRATLRAIVIVVGLIETVLVAVFVALMLQSSDPLGRAIGTGMATLVAVPYGVLVVPGLALGLANRWLPLALAFTVAAVPATLIAWRWA